MTSPEAVLSPTLQAARAVASRVLRRMAPPPSLSVSQWADAYRMLSSESSAEPGPWRTTRVPYLRDIMDAFSDPSIREVVMMMAAQSGKTEVFLNVVGYFADQDPSPMMLVQPTLEMAEVFSKDRLAPMIRDTPVLSAKFATPKKKESGNTLRHKVFPGGFVALPGANSPATLASRPVRVVVGDEIDRWPASAGTEGDPVDLASKRSTTFWNRKLGLASTPTTTGLSRIERAYESTDMRHYYVPCPHCGEFQTLKWAQVSWPDGEPQSAFYACEKCGSILTGADKPAMLLAGQWRSSAPFKGKAGFRISALYSPWLSFGDLAVEFLDAKKSPETLRVFVNTRWAETFDDAAESVSDIELFNRRETYGPIVPMGVGVITAGADVQDDRIEVEVVGHGRSAETWNLDIHVIYGDPAQPSIWADLDNYLLKRWTHESGASLPIAAAFIDSGHYTAEVYAFVEHKAHRRIYASKGAKKAGSPLLITPTRKSKVRKVRLFIVGTDTAKLTLFARMRITEPGPGYMHFPLTRDEEYFKQLTAEKKVIRHFKGRPIRDWVKTRPRNEVLDMRILALAALAMLSPNLELICKRLALGGGGGSAPPQSKKNWQVFSKGVR